MEKSNYIFLSYRREDSADVTGRIYDRLLVNFDKQNIFKDVDSVPLGIDFQKYIHSQVGKCNIMLAVIGKDWLNIKNKEGKLRLHDPQDFVRIEIESALNQNIHVIPLLVHGTEIPNKEQLPESLRALVNRNGKQIHSDPYFHHDMKSLIVQLENILGTSEESAEKEEAIFDQQQEYHWRNTLSKDSISTYKHYLEQYPDGKHANEAQKAISRLKSLAAEKKAQQKEKELWGLAIKADTVKSYNEYLKNTKLSTHCEEAKLRLKDLAMEAEGALNRIRQNEIGRPTTAGGPSKDINDKGKSFTSNKLAYTVAFIISSMAILLFWQYFQSSDADDSLNYDNGIINNTTQKKQKEIDNNAVANLDTNANKTISKILNDDDKNKLQEKNPDIDKVKPLNLANKNGETESANKNKIPEEKMEDKKETSKRLIDLPKSFQMLSTESLYTQAIKMYEAKNYTEALKLFMDAADAGNVDAMNYVGLFHHNGLEINQNYEKAFEWYKKAADKGHIVSMSNIGLLHQYGLGRKKDHKKALEWHEKAALANNSLAMYYMGQIYSDEQGNEKDYKKALEWYKKSIKLNGNSADAHVNLGFLLIKMGRSNEAKTLLTKATKLGSLDFGNMNLGHVWLCEGNSKMAISFYETSLARFKNKQVFWEGMVDDLQYLKQYGITIKTYQDVLSQINALSQSQIQKKNSSEKYAQALEKYRLKQYNEAFSLFLKVAATGSLEAKVYIGYMYDKGHGVKQDYSIAMSWYRKAAERGYAVGLYNIGVFYENGQGVKQDITMAKKFYKWAAEFGDIKGKNSFNRLSK